MYHQPPPAANRTVAATAPIHRPFLLPPEAVAAASSVGWKRSELKRGTFRSAEGTKAAPPSYSCGSGVLSEPSSALGCTGASANATQEGSACDVTTGAGVEDAGTGVVPDGVIAAFRASGSSHDGIFTSWSKELKGRCCGTGARLSTDAG